MILIDSNIPMYLVGGDHANKRRALELLDEGIDANQRLLADVEVLQEILHRYDAIERRDAIQPAFDVLLSIVYETLPVELQDVENAKEILLATAELSARDSLHVAVMRCLGALLWTTLKESAGYVFGQKITESMKSMTYLYLCTKAGENRIVC